PTRILTPGESRTTAGSSRVGSSGVCSVPNRRRPARLGKEIASTIGIDLLQPIERCGLQPFGTPVELPDFTPKGLLAHFGKVPLWIGACERLQVIAFLLLVICRNLCDERRSVVGAVFPGGEQGRRGARLEQCLT